MRMAQCPTWSPPRHLRAFRSATRCWIKERPLLRMSLSASRKSRKAAPREAPDLVFGQADNPLCRARRSSLDPRVVGPILWSPKPEGLPDLRALVDGVGAGLRHSGNGHRFEPLLGHSSPDYEAPGG